MSATLAAVQRDILLFPRQHQFVSDRARFPGYVGGIGSGKSFAGAAKCLPRLAHPGLGGVFAPTYPMLRDATQRTLFGMLDQLGIGYEFRKGENAVTIPASGHEIIFRSLDDPEKVRGPNLDWAWIDEASLVERMAWSIVIGRVRVGDLPQTWATFTPKGRNWCWEVWERDADVNHPLYRVRTDENPELPEGFAASLGYAGRFAEQELGGEFVAFEGLVYPMFSRPTHVKTVETDGWPGIIGVDAGTKNPSAIVTIRYSGDARHQSREVYRRGMGNDELNAEIRAEADLVGNLLTSIEVDPSAAGLITDLTQAGYPVRKANNNVTEGIREVTTALAHGMTVDPACVYTIAEYESYQYPEGSKRETDNPIKANDHALDAVRYACQGLAAPKPAVWVM